MSVPIRIDHLAELQGAIRRAGEDLPKTLELFLAAAAKMTAGDAQGLVPTRTGAARASLRADGARVTGGGTRAPYFGWLEFGGRTGINNSVERRFVRGGRYIWPAFDANRKRLMGILDDDVADAVRRAGLEVT